MKLAYRIVLHLSWLLSLLLAAWAVLFYLTMVDQINDEVDDSLELRAEQLMMRSLAGRILPAESAGSNSSHFLREISAEEASERHRLVYTDETIFIPEKDETEPARVLRAIFNDADARWYELTVLTPTIEKSDLREAMLWWISGLYLLLLLTILLVNLLVLSRMLRPLYALLRWLDNYEVSGQNAPLEDRTNVSEFRRLNDAARRSAERSEYLFERQKQFIGNASHEMQTPLAVCSNRLELLVGDGSALSEEQLGELLKVRQTLDYLVRLNRSLLLLSKIDSGQFPESEPVEFNPLVRRTSEDLAEIYAGRKITLSIDERAELRSRMNPSLAGSLVANLLKNAFVHGRSGGHITVEITADSLRVSNDAISGSLDGGRLFERFYQGEKKEGSTGLGLSMVDAISRLYGLKVGYTYIDNRHCFEVKFPVKN